MYVWGLPQIYTLAQCEYLHCFDTEVVAQVQLSLPWELSWGCLQELKEKGELSRQAAPWWQSTLAWLPLNERVPSALFLGCC